MANNGTKFGQRPDFRTSASLDQDVSQDRCFDRTREYSAVASVRRELVEQSIAGTAADDVDNFYLVAADLLEAFENVLVFQRQAFQSATDQRAFGIRNRLSSFPAEATNSSRHIRR